jgi:hypothetical protein
VNLRQLSLDEFLCSDNPANDAPADLSVFLALRGVVEPLVGRLINQIGGGYSLHGGKQPGDTMLLYEGRLVGFYLGETLAIDPAHQRRNLSVPLILAAVGDRTLPERRTFSHAGRGALIKAWKVAHGQGTVEWDIAGLLA